MRQGCGEITERPDDVLFLTGGMFQNSADVKQISNLSQKNANIFFQKHSSPEKKNIFQYFYLLKLTAYPNPSCNIS